MGDFDDLIPNKGGGGDFDDLIPQNAAQQAQAKARPKANDSDFARMISGTPKRKAATYNLTGIPGVSTQVGAALDGLQHHLMNIPVGLAQYAVNDMAFKSQLLPDGNPVTSYLTREASKGNRQVREREDDYQARTGDTFGSYVGAAIGEVAPWLAGVGILRGAGALPTITSRGLPGAAKKGGLLAAEGAGMGAMQPVVGDGSYGDQKAMQMATGAVAAPLLAGGVRGAQIAARGAGRGARYLTPGGREQIADERVAKLYGADADVLRALRGNTGQGGYSFTPAQAIGTPEAVQAERALRNNGLTAPAFAAQESANNAALREQVERLAGSDADVRAARAARKAATEPYYARLPGQRVDPAPILAQLDALANSSLGVRPNIKSAATSLRAEIQSRTGDDGKIGADILSGLNENAGSHLGPMASAQEKLALGPLRDSITETLDAAIPGYRDNLAAYARTSQPITDMAAGRTLLDAIDSGGRDAGGNQAVTLTQVKSLLAKDAKAKYKMSPQARQQLEGLLDALQRRSITNNTVAASGPGTAADTLRGGLQSPMAQRGISGVAATIGGIAGGLPGSIAALLASEGAIAANSAVTRKVGQKAATARSAADAIEAHNRRLLKRDRGFLSEYGMPAYLLPYVNE